MAGGCPGRAYLIEPRWNCSPASLEVLRSLAQPNLPAFRPHPAERRSAASIAAGLVSHELHLYHKSDVRETRGIQSDQRIRIHYAIHDLRSLQRIRITVKCRGLYCSGPIPGNVLLYKGYHLYSCLINPDRSISSTKLPSTSSFGLTSAALGFLPARSSSSVFTPSTVGFGTSGNSGRKLL